MNLLIRLIGEQRLCDLYRRHAAKQIRQGMVAEFQDDKGRWYYSFKDPQDVPITRLAEAQTSMQFLAAGLTPDLFEKAMDTLTVCLAKSEIVKAGGVIASLTELNKRIVNLDAVVNIIAINYVREDEDTVKVNPTIHAEKCEFLKTETEEGRFFFRLPMFASLLTNHPVSKEQSTQLWQAYQTELERLNLQLKHYRSEKLPTE
jgi:hypothetical protein